MVSRRSVGVAAAGAVVVTAALVVVKATAGADPGSGEVTLRFDVETSPVSLTDLGSRASRLRT